MAVLLQNKGFTFQLPAFYLYDVSTGLRYQNIFPVGQLYIRLLECGYVAQPVYDNGLHLAVILKNLNTLCREFAYLLHAASR